MKKPVDSLFNILYFVLIILAGIVSTFFPLLVSILWALMVIYCIIGLIFNNKKHYIWYAIAMSPGLEVWSRMAKAPGVPWEVGKYFLFFVIILFLFNNLNRRSFYNVGTYILLAITPSLIFAIVDLPFNYENWVMHAAGIVQIGILLIFASKERWTKELFFKTLGMSLLPIIAILIYVTIRTPKFDDVAFKLVANSQTTGGFGSNQISTIIGVILLVLGILIFSKKSLFNYSIFNYAILLFGFFRGLLTFSRGGIISAIIALLIFCLILFWGNRKLLTRVIIFFVFITIVGSGVAYFANNISGNQLSLRYRGETASTLDGSKQKSLNTLTTSRYSIAETDILIFGDYFLFGVGPGEAQNHRVEYGGPPITAHTEYTRLLSEHGIGGLFTVFLITLFPFFWIKRIKTREGKAISAALFILALANSFHAAMRTNTTVVFYVLAAIPVFYSYKKTESASTDEVSLLKTNLE